ncbi:MAG: hypothetical protein NDJ90_11510 [Oligoflexia bacterium]|nr:hypothetical protein [Oligoflexia bacterium]
MRLTIVLFGVCLSSLAIADTARIRLDCARMPGGGDEGYEVSVSTKQGGRGTAVLYVVDPGGKRPVRRYSVKHLVADPQSPGSSDVFKGKDFLLEVYRDGRPTEEGYLPASLVAIDDQRIQWNEELYCEEK